MYTKKLKAWLSQFKQDYFTYSKGFFHLPYNGDSPRSMIESFEGFPFVEHAKDKQHLYSNNPFCKGGFYYQELERGCWIVYSKAYYNANVAYDLLYRDKGTVVSDREDDYYILSLNSVSNVPGIKKADAHETLYFPQYSWTFFKPEKRHCDLNFKGADCKFITLYFNERWLKTNLMPNQLFAEAGLDRFIGSDADHILWPLKAKDEVLNRFDLFEQVMNIGGDAKRVDLLRLKFTTLSLIFDFCRICQDLNIVNKTIAVEYKEGFTMNTVEAYLRAHVYERFPGVSFLARKFGISETKLKTEFKQVFGKPLYRYFQDRQMEKARELILENQLLIKDIAFKFGYESAGKFSVAFKKYHGASPSALTKSL